MFEEKAVDFADVLVPFCRATGAEIPPALLSMVKDEVEISDESLSDDDRPLVNGTASHDSEAGININIEAKDPRKFYRLSQTICSGSD